MRLMVFVCGDHVDEQSPGTRGPKVRFSGSVSFPLFVPTTTRHPSPSVGLTSTPHRTTHLAIPRKRPPKACQNAEAPPSRSHSDEVDQYARASESRPPSPSRSLADAALYFGADTEESRRMRRWRVRYVPLSFHFAYVSYHRAGKTSLLNVFTRGFFTQV